MTDRKTTKTRRLFSAVAWGAVALALTGTGMADIASAAEQRSFGRDAGEANNSPRPERRGGQERQSAPAPATPRVRAQVTEPPRRSADQNRERLPIMTEARRGAISRQQENAPPPRREAPDNPRGNRPDPRDNPGGPRDNPGGPRDNPGDRRDDRQDQRNDRRNDRRDDRRDDRNDRRYERRDDRRDYRDAQRWNRNEWRRNYRYDWRSYRARNHSVYRAGRYRVPYYGYHYRRLGVGFTLRSLFFSSSYWIADPWYYRLPEVYGPYRWVRYYDDVLLVNIYTGEVVDVIYDFFW